MKLNCLKFNSLSNKGFWVKKSIWNVSSALFLLFMGCGLTSNNNSNDKLNEKLAYNKDNNLKEPLSSVSKNSESSELNIGVLEKENNEGMIENLKVNNELIELINKNPQYQVDLSRFTALIPFYNRDVSLIEKVNKLPYHSSLIVNSPVPGGEFMNSLYFSINNKKFSKEDINNVKLEDLNPFEKILYYSWKNDNKVLSYIATNSGELTFDKNKSDPDRDWILPDGNKLVNIKSKIDKVLEQYNVDGFFFDEVDWGANPELYKKIYNYLKKINPKFIITLNSGYTTEEEAMQYSDLTVMIENYPEYIKQWEENYRDYMKNYPEYKSAILGHSCSKNDIKSIVNHYNNTDIDGNKNTHFLVYLTQDGKDGNPWDSLDLSIFNYIDLNYNHLTYSTNKIDTNNIKIKTGISWYWQLSNPIDSSNINLSYDLYDIDLFDNSKETIKKLKDKGKIVICYFSAGTWEKWRYDANQFPNSILGNDLEGFSDEKWLNISKYERFSHIIKKRIELARNKGCDGIEPDNLDAYDNDSGFNISEEDSVKYFKFLANEAHRNGLLIALKNSSSIVSDVVDIADFAIVEECFKYNECSEYKPFITKNKAVLEVEYELPKYKFCGQSKKMKFSSAKACYDLDGCWDVCSNID